jgi:flagellar M-ring protein FliF
MGAVAVGLIGFFIFLMLRLSSPQMEMLYSDLTLEDSSSVVSELEGRGIEFELRSEGSTVLVPSEHVLRMRLALAEQGLPAGGSVGYEIFDTGETLGATSFVQNINHLRALEGELARTIRAIDRVQLARVHLVLSERELFARDSAEASASIIVRTRGELDSSQIRAIQHLVASAVKELQPDHVAIVDENGSLLASGAGDGSGSALYGSLEERSIAFEQRMERQLLEIVSSVVGTDNARVQVTAELDYNSVTQTSDIYDPDGQVVRSTQTREQESNATDTSGEDAVSVGNELPGAGADDAEIGAGSSENSSTTEETVNYEISRTTTTEILEAGRIKRISVAVLLDGNYLEAADGTTTYQPRPQEQLDQISTLIRSAIGYDNARGDQVEVVNLQFAAVIQPDELGEVEGGFLNLTKDDYFYIAELATLLILALLVLLFVVRPLVRRIVTPDEGVAIGAGSTPQLTTGPNGEPIAQLTGPDGETLAMSDNGTPLLPNQTTATSSMIDATQVVGEMHEASLKKIGDLVQRNPDEAIAIVRQWLSKEAA